MSGHNQMSGAAAMRAMGDMIRACLPAGWGFALIVFQFHKPGLANYISSAERETMLKALKETYHRLSKGQDIETPEEN